MNTNSKRLSIYLVVMLLGTAIATTLRTIACMNHLDYASGYFTDKSLISVADPMIWATVAIMLSYLFVSSKAKLRASFSTGATYIPSAILAVSVFFLGVRALTYAMNVSRYPIFSAETLRTPSVLIGVLTFVLSLATVAYLFFNAYFVESKSSTRSYFAICAIAFFALYSILIYLDTTLSTNSHGKIVNQMAYIFSALFFLYETRISLGREMWRAYTAFGLMAAALTAYSSIPTIITYYASGRLIFAASSGASLSSVEECMATLMLFVFIVCRLVLTITLPEEKENKLVKAMGEYAERREDRVEESYARHQESFAAKQMSFFELYGDEESDEVEISEPTEEIAVEQTEDEPKAPTISDDAIYESIFGRMPEKPEKKVEQTPEEPDEEKDPEVIADEILSAVDEAMKEAEANDKDE